MTSFETYVEYLALKCHFRGEFDYIKYRGKVKVDTETFDARKDKIFFEKLAKHRDVHNFLVANFAKNENTYIRDLVQSEECDTTYREWSKRQQSLSYILKSDISKLEPDFNNNIVVRSFNHPPLMKMYLGGEICLETLCILLDVSRCYNHWNTKMESDFIWKSISNRVLQYIPFIDYDRKKVKKIIVDYFSQ